MFERSTVAERIVFRGGTALHKLYFDVARRYSEDIDLVQRDAGPIGELIGEIRDTLDPWLGEPKWKQGWGQFTLYYRFETTFVPVLPMRLKIEINTREHFSVLGVSRRPFAVENPWFRGKVEIPVYRLEELLATKMRALYQRKKGRDVFDLWVAHEDRELDPSGVVHCFLEYMRHGGLRVSRAEFEENLLKKCNDPAFRVDIAPLLAPDVKWNFDHAVRYVQSELVRRLPGKPWKEEKSER
jgi:predicted nucleotidyltransferase component of viral defense system